jgi:uncharacterized membrane protein YfcA
LETLPAVLLAGVAVVVGFFIGTVGVGGVLLIPFLVILGGLTIHGAASTALFSFLFTGLLGTWLFQKRGSIDWRLAVPVCGAAVPFSYVGARVAAHVDARPLTAIIAAIIVVAGIFVLRPAKEKAGAAGATGRGATLRLLLIGAVSGFGAGLSGAGGPVFSVPIMIVAGFAALPAVGVSQVLQILAAIFGSVAALQDGRIAYGIGAWVTVFELVGVAVGVRVAHAVRPLTLRRIAGCLCIVLGTFMFFRLS